ncbi:Peroxidase 3 [Orobanche hederae]
MGYLEKFEIYTFLLLGLLLVASTHAKLEMRFYAKSCPKAEKIVQDYVNMHIRKAPSLAAPLLRMHFHDCFVRGCDASLLLNSTPSNGNQTEKFAAPNLTLRGFDFIDRVKSRLEAECPGVVSCADITALVARDAINANDGPFWKVPTGRRDGTVSHRLEALTEIPSPTDNFTTLHNHFQNKGLNLRDLVLLSGAHTIGISHCSSFTKRLYNFTGNGDQDPTMDDKYAANLKANKCKSINSTKIVEMDPGSLRSFDLSYYKLVLKRMGLFESDAALLTSSVTKSYITQIVRGSLDHFYEEFANSMEKMGRIEVKAGFAGEIRKHCAFVNS